MKPKDGIFTESDQPISTVHCMKCGLNKHLPALAKHLESEIDIRDKEIASLRSVLSEWDQDKSCFSQWVIAEQCREKREE